jgi:predicted RNase H-like HicB family nuclease
MLKYTVILIPEEEGGYSVEVPALPLAATRRERPKKKLLLWPKKP